MADIDLARIKGNVAKMAAQNAPESDIDGYIASEGTTIDAVRAFKVPAVTTTPTAQSGPTGYDASLPAQGLSGLNEGIANALGAPVDLTNLALRGGAAAVHALGGPDVELPVDAFGGSQTVKGFMGGAIKAPTQDAGGQIVRRIGQEVGATVVPGMGPLAHSATPIREGIAQLGTSLASGAGAAAAQQIAPNNPWADVAGQILGGGAFGGTYKALQKAVTPLPIDAQRAAMNDIMRQNGVQLTAGQASGSKGLQYAESELGGGAANNAMTRQAEQFTSAALSRSGVTAPRATPEVMDQAFTDVGNEFSGVATRNNVVHDRQLGADLSATVNHYNSIVSPSNRVPVVDDTIRDITSYARAGTMTGEQYGDLRSRLNKIGRQTARTDPHLSEAVFGIQNALDDAFERSVATTNPGDLAAIQEARQHYRNLIVIEDAVGRAGPAAADGFITPGNLRGAVQRQNKRAYVRGRGDLAGLARAGVSTMTPLPQSGTTPRAVVHGILPSVGTAAGLLLGQGDAGHAALGGLAGLAANRAAGAALLSGAGRGYLSNQLWGGGLGLGPAQAATALGGAFNDLHQPLAITVRGAAPR